MSLNWFKSLVSPKAGSKKPAKASMFRPSVLELEDRRVLATLYVDDDFATGTVFNPGRVDSVNVTNSALRFTTISAAVAAAAPNDVIRVGVGSFVLPVGAVINKNLSIIGSTTYGSALSNAPALVTRPLSQVNFDIPLSTFTPSGNTPGLNGDTAAWVLVNNNASFTVANVNMDGTGRLITQALRVVDTGAAGAGTTVRNVQFTNIQNGLSTGIGVVALDGTVNIIDSTFTGIGGAGALYTGAATNGTVNGMDFNGFAGTANNNRNAGVQIDTGADVLVTNSFFRNAVGIEGAGTPDEVFSSAIQIFDSGSTLTAIGNLFIDNLIAISAGAGTFDNNGNLVTADAATVVANYNNFVGANQQALNFGALSIAPNLQFNFFGSRTGPTTSQIVDEGDNTFTGTVNTSGFLTKRTWVWNGTSAADYLANTSFMVATNDVGNGQTLGSVRVYANGVPVNGTTVGGVRRPTNYNPFGAYAGGLSADIGDVNGDYRPDVIVAARVGSSATNSSVKVFDLKGMASGTFYAPLMDFFAFNQGFNGGSFVRAANLNGDLGGVGEIVVSRGGLLGGNPGAQVRGYAYDSTVNNQTGGLPVAVGARQIFSQATAFGAGYAGAISIGSGDLNNDGSDEYVVGAISAPVDVRAFSFTGTGPAPAFSGGNNGINTGTVGGFGGFNVAPGAIFATPGVIGGFVDAGDLDGDGIAEVIVGAGNGGFVSVLKSNSGTFARTTQFTAYAGFNGGVRVAVARSNGTSAAPRIVTGPGVGIPTSLRSFSATGTQEIANLQVFGGGFAGGLNVGG